MKHALLHVFLLGLAFPTAALAHPKGEKPDNQAEALALISRSAELTHIRSPGRSPFKLTARVRLAGLTGGVAEGSYLLIWVSANQWREEITFPGFWQLRVGGESKFWQQRTPSPLPSTRGFS